MIVKEKEVLSLACWRGVIVPMPTAPRPSSMGATRIEIARGRLREWLGRMANRLGAPGAIRDTEIQDEVTGQHVAVRVGHLFVRLSINGRDYYFDRVTGRFDGSGIGCG